MSGLRCIKVQLGNEIRKLNKVPSSLDELEHVLVSLFGRKNFEITYQNEKTEVFNISTDQELADIYELGKNQMSLKFVLKEIPEEISVFDRIDFLRKSLMLSVKPASDVETMEDFSDVTVISENSSEKMQEPVAEVQSENKVKVVLNKLKKAKKVKKNVKKPKMPQKPKIEEPTHDDVSCDNCGQTPITGIRYKCITCANFDLCANCELALNHPHPMIKIKTPISLQLPVFISDSFSALKSFLTAHIKESLKKKFKAKVKQYLFQKGLSVLPGAIVKIAWEIMNNGKKTWPAGSKFAMKKGDFLANSVNLPIVNPGEKIIVEVEIATPEVEKDCKGVWEIVVGEKRFGKIEALLSTSHSVRRIWDLVSMGFDYCTAKNALKMSNGDVDLAVSHILQ